MSLLTKIAAPILRRTKSQAELDAMLLRPGLSHRPLVTESAVLAGADVHVDDDHALRTVAYAGNAALTELLIRRYQMPKDRGVLQDIQRKAGYFNDPKINQIFDRVLGPTIN